MLPIWNQKGLWAVKISVTWIKCKGESTQSLVLAQCWISHTLSVSSFPSVQKKNPEGRLTRDLDSHPYPNGPKCVTSSQARLSAYPLGVLLAGSFDHTTGSYTFTPGGVCSAVHNWSPVYTGRQKRTDRTIPRGSQSQIYGVLRGLLSVCC